MMGTNTTADRFLSEPMTIHFAGWQTDTLRLQQAGWELSAEQDICRCALRLGIRHQGLQMYGVTTIDECVDYRSMHYDRQSHVQPGRMPELHLQYMAARITVQVMDDFSNFQAIDAQPQYLSGPAAEIKDIEDFGIWALPMARSEEIIVDPHDVDMLLKMIRDIQLPEQEAIRKRNSLRQDRNAMLPEHQPRQNFHAQILSIAS